jgi:hypothetical protein
MPTQKTHDVSLKIGEYTDNQGATKARRKQSGTLFQREDGSLCVGIDSTLITMEAQYIANPKRNSLVYLDLYPIKDDEQPQQRRNTATQQQAAPQQQAASAKPAASPEFNDEIPF